MLPNSRHRSITILFIMEYEAQLDCNGHTRYWLRAGVIAAVYLGYTD